MAKFKPGNIVALKSGSPPMTVEKVTGTDTAPGYWCSWFAGAKDNRRHFEEAALKEVDLPE